jgi:hypothetical protein
MSFRNLKPSLLFGTSNISVLAVRIKIRQAVRVVSLYSMAEENFALVFWIEDEQYIVWLNAEIS